MNEFNKFMDSEIITKIPRKKSLIYNKQIDMKTFRVFHPIKSKQETKVRLQQL